MTCCIHLFGSSVELEYLAFGFIGHVYHVWRYDGLRDLARRYLVHFFSFLIVLFLCLNLVHTVMFGSHDCVVSSFYVDDVRYVVYDDSHVF